MTWREFTIHVMAHEKKELAELHRTRAIVYMIYKMNTGDKIIKRPDQVMPLPDDKLPDRGKKMEDDEVVRSIKLLKSF